MTPGGDGSHMIFMVVVITMLVALFAGGMAFWWTRMNAGQKAAAKQSARDTWIATKKVAADAAKKRRLKATSYVQTSRGKKRLAVVDIEIANVFTLRPGEDLDDHGPFDISVAATLVHGEAPLLWYSKNDSGSPAHHLTKADAGRLLKYLDSLQSSGHALVAWNGLSFDLRWIGHAAGDLPLARKVASNLYDPMFQFFKLKGFPVGLAKVAKGLGLPGKKLMNGADAPKRWQAGDHQAVFDYVQGDVILTAEVALAICRAGGVRWVTQRGKVSEVEMQRLRAANQCMRDPMPDQSWMDTPLPQEKFTAWFHEQ